MGKKRKAEGRPFGDAEPTEESEKDSKLRINTYEDVADSEDEFHINRDKILLDERPAQKRQRKMQEEEELLEPSDEEVLAVSEDVSDSEDDYEDAEEAAEPSVRHSKLKRPSKITQDSDSEASAAPEEDVDAGGWGNSRQDYYNADTIETEADALEEEAEARRLQRKQLQGMTEADFGFDEAEWLATGKDEGDGSGGEGRGKIVRETLPRLEITDAMGTEERSKVLRTRYPEFEPLAKEFLDLQSMYDDFQIAATEAVAAQNSKLQGANAMSDPEDRVTPIECVKYSALSAYLAVLCMYFGILTSGPEHADGKRSVIPPEELREHVIMETLVQCRDLWYRVKNVIVTETSTTGNAEVEVSNKVNGHAHSKSDLVTMHNNSGGSIQKRKHRKSKGQKTAEKAEIEAETQLAERLRKTEEELDSLPRLAERIKQPSKPTKSSSAALNIQEDADSDFGEQTTLTAHGAAEKAKRKKSLRFYTSQIAQKSNKRDAAGRDAGGDADLPYRERLKDRQARLNAEAESRGKKPKPNSKGDALGGPSDEEDHAVAKELRNGDGSGSEDYYDLVASKAADKKAAKAALAAAHAQAEKEGGIVRVVDDNRVGEDGKRAISYMIGKNKASTFQNPISGITPKRKKDVRNPRVKKRNKYESKLKKLGSTKQIYKGGEGRAGYQGEKTGIKKGLVKSVKL